MERYALTGTPGTGKTTISALLQNDLISLSDYYEEFSDGRAKDGEWVVNIKRLESSIESLEWEVAEGNFSHQLNIVDKVIVLRCDPAVLVNRLKERNYSNKKIRENLEAEAMGIIYSETVRNYGIENLIQVDTSKKTSKECSIIIRDYINNNIKVEEEIDYLERILDWY
ncbi:MAG: toxin [Euryarchaeota archaeon]|nr:toxin [Euryarchaeota archaeon]